VKWGQAVPGKEIYENSTQDLLLDSRRIAGSYPDMQQRVCSQGLFSTPVLERDITAQQDVV